MRLTLLWVLVAAVLLRAAWPSCAACTAWAACGACAARTPCAACAACAA